MGHIKEPVGIDLVVVPMPLSEEDRKALSTVIAQYKLTKEVPKSKAKLAKTIDTKRTTKPRAKGRESATKKTVVMPSK